jgi:type I restriction enzyme, S subunit
VQSYRDDFFAWEQRKLGDVGETYTGLSGKTKEDFGHGEASFVTYMNVYSNPVSDLKMTEPIEIDNHQNEVKYGDVFFTTSSETPEEVGMASVWTGNKNNTYLNSFCFGYRPLQKIDPYYLSYLLHSESVRRKIIILAQGISRYNISKKGVMEISTTFPSLDEQDQIGSLFQHIDHTITLHEEKKRQLERLKSALLQKMFADKSGYPAVRFRRYNTAWKQAELGNLMDVGSVKRIHQSDWQDSGIRFLRARDIVAEYKHEKIDKKLYIDKNIYIKYSMLSGKVHSGDLLVTGVGTIGIPMLIKNEIPIYFKDGNIIWFKNNNTINGYFLYYSFSSKNIRNFIKASAGTGTVVTYTIENGKKTPIILPSNQVEQREIGLCFHQLDYLISLYQKKIDRLNSIKQSFLQQMFI